MSESSFRTYTPFLFTIENRVSVYQIEIFVSISEKKRICEHIYIIHLNFLLEGAQSQGQGQPHPQRRHRKYVVHSPLFFGEEVVTCKEGEPGWEIYTRCEFGRREGGERKGLGGLSGPEETSCKAEVTFVESRASAPFPSPCRTVALPPSVVCLTCESKGQTLFYIPLHMNLLECHVSGYRVF